MHFAKAGWLSMLRHILDGRAAVIPDTVVYELELGARQHPAAQLVLDASWINRRELASADEQNQFALFSALLVARDRNWGEAGVLAYAKAHGLAVVVDDGAARKAAKVHGVKLTGTLGLLCEATRSGRLTIELASKVADHLIESEYRLPFKPGEFATWAQENGQVRPPDR